MPFFIIVNSLLSQILLYTWYNYKMIYPRPQIVFGLLILSTAVVLIYAIRYNPFGEDEDGL